MAAWVNSCRYVPTLGGTTDWTFSAVVIGYNTPALAGIVNGRAYKYRAENADLSQWEEGEGTYNTSTGVLTRTAVLYNSSGTGTGAGQSGAGTKISFSTVPQVAIVALKEDMISIEEANSFTAAQKTQARSNIGAVNIAGDAMTGLLQTAPSDSNIQKAGSSDAFMLYGPTSGTAAYMTFHMPSMFAGNFGMLSDGNLYMGGFSFGANQYQLWTKRDFATIPVPAGSVMLFYQASAPTGWTQVTTQNDKALRVVSGTGGVAGGTNAFSTVMAQTVVGNTTLSAAQIPPHTHGYYLQYYLGSAAGLTGSALCGAGANLALSTYSAVPPQNTDGGTGGGGAHNHPITMAIQYIDLILASKN